MMRGGSSFPEQFEWRERHVAGPAGRLGPAGVVEQTGRAWEPGLLMDTIRMAIRSICSAEGQSDDRVPQ